MFFFCSKKSSAILCGEASASGDDVGRDLIFDELDAVAQLQLALLQPLQPQEVGRGRLMQRIDRGVEIAVFLLQPCELGVEFALIFVGHGLLNQNADEICENSGKPISNYPPWQPAPQARSIRTNSAFRGRQRRRVPSLTPDGGPFGLPGSKHCADAFCFGRGAPIPLLRKGFARPAHDSLQLPVKYEDSDFQTHRQIQARV
jgi:hypothetical protein